MVNKKVTPPRMLTRSRSVPCDLRKAARPKRNISPKNLKDDSAGLSWREERELKKALYASLQESRRPSREEPCEEEDNDTSSLASTPCLIDRYGNIAKSTSHNRLNALCISACMNGRKSNGDDMKKKKIHAQRKFAQGCLPSTPTETPSKPRLKVSPVKLFPVRPKTEDFLTYLCFRGTSLLPPHLDLMNAQKEEPLSGEGSQPGTPSTNGRAVFTRDSSPASSSTSHSHNNEDGLDAFVMPSRAQTPNRKAARACAGTPETARGFVSLRANLVRKKSAQNRTLLSTGFIAGRQTKYSSHFTTVLRQSKAKRDKSAGKRRTVNDRLLLKKKAMATLTAAKLSPQKQDMHSACSLRHSVSDSELVRRKSGSGRQSQMTPLVKNNTFKATRTGWERHVSKLKEEEMSGKRKTAPSSVDDKIVSPSKRCKRLRSSVRVKNALRLKTKPSNCSKTRKRCKEMEQQQHQLSTGKAPSKVKCGKVSGPVTRASSHMKSAIATAKRLAARKLTLVKTLGQVTTAGTREQSRPAASNGRQRDIRLSTTDQAAGEPERVLREEAGQSEAFPKLEDPAAVVQCPTFYPTEDQFKDPVAYIQSVSGEAEAYGMCRIVPPSSWKMESRVIEDMRFTTQIQHIHRLQHRWGPCSHRMECIKRHFESSGTDKFQLPQIGGVELDLVKLYELVKKYGGMQRIVDKKKWIKVADAMKIPKQSQDRVTKLYAAYCKLLLSYETLSEEERDKIDHSVQTDRQKREKSRIMPITDRSVTRGRSQPLSAFGRAARNIQMMYGREGEASPQQIEADYWKILEDGSSHVSVQGASLDTSIYGSMFPVTRDNLYSRHPWNLHNLVQSKGSVLHHLGLIADVTVPTLHVRMLYSTSCLATSVHHLPVIHYHHQGDSVIWYAVPHQQQDKLKKALQKLVPANAREKGGFLQRDTVMIPPSELIENDVSLSRCVQSVRQFVVIFPAVHSASISCGHSMSESVYYATQDWIPSGCNAAKALSANQEAEQFSMDAMLVFLAEDPTTPDSTLALVQPYLEQVVEREIAERQKLYNIGLKTSQKLQAKISKTTHRADVIEEINICDISKKICYLSMVLNEAENSAFCLEQGLIHIQKKRNIKHCKLMYRFTEEELRALVHDVKRRLQSGSSSSASPPKKKKNK